MPPPSTETPLLTVTNHRSSRRTQSLTTAARYLRLANSRRLLRDLPMHISDSPSQSGWTYSWPAIILDLVFNLVFIVASICVMITSVNEDPGVQLRLWIGVYAVQCGVHVVCVCVECKRKWDQDRVRVLDGESFEAMRDENSSSRSDEEIVVLNVDREDVIYDHREAEEASGLAELLEYANTVISFFWWVIGFSWIYIYGENLTHDSPQLYWLCIAFLVFDVFFVVICVAVAFVRFATCVCLPYIHAILYALEDQEDGVEGFLGRFPRYKFQRNGVFREKQNGNSQNEEIEEVPSGKMTECDTDTPTEHVLPLEDAVCCICLCAYDDGNLLRRLPCLHHFHSACICRWLYLNATCPLCKKNIFQYVNYSGRDEV